MLEDLAEELDAACAEGTLPRSLTVDQVWVLPDGRAQLLIAPLLGATSPETRSAVPVVEAVDATDDERALRLLRDVAITALEGKPRPATGTGDWVRAPVPAHAADMLRRFFGGRRYWTVDDLRHDLEATRERPVEVTRLRRAGHLALMDLLLHVPFGGPTMMLLQSFLELYWFAEKNAEGNVHLASEPIAWGVIGLCCGLWVAWAFAFRGGYAYWRGGIVLRRADGRKASRLQCALRALLVWAPVGGLLSLAIAVAHYDPSLPLLYFGIWGLGVLLLPIYAVLALSNPTRSLHDRIAGTYLMPE